MHLSLCTSAINSLPRESESSVSLRISLKSGFALAMPVSGSSSPASESFMRWSHKSGFGSHTGAATAGSAAMAAAASAGASPSVAAASAIAGAGAVSAPAIAASTSPGSVISTASTGQTSSQARQTMQSGSRGMNGLRSDAAWPGESIHS